MWCRIKKNFRKYILIVQNIQHNCTWHQSIKKKYDYFKQKKAHFLFPIFTGALGGWLGMLLTPTIGAIFIAISLYLALVIFVPWNKLSWLKFIFHHEYYIPAIITFLIILPTWNKLISMFPTSDPYKQLLRTGEANIEVIAEPNGVMSGGLRSYAGLGQILLIKDDNIILEMNKVAGRQQLENNQVRFFARPELYLKDKSINMPIYKIAEAETVIMSFERLPPNSKILHGEIVLVFNSSVYVTIPVPPQTMKNDVIIIKDVQKYFKKKQL